MDDWTLEQVCGHFAKLGMTDTAAFASVSSRDLAKLSDSGLQQLGVPQDVRDRHTAWLFENLDYCDPPEEKQQAAPKSLVSSPPRQGGCGTSRIVRLEQQLQRVKDPFVTLRGPDGIRHGRTSSHLRLGGEPIGAEMAEAMRLNANLEAVEFVALPPGGGAVEWEQLCRVVAATSVKKLSFRIGWVVLTGLSGCRLLESLTFTEQPLPKRLPTLMVATKKTLRYVTICGSVDEAVLGTERERRGILLNELRMESCTMYIDAAAVASLTRHLVLTNCSLRSCNDFCLGTNTVLQALTLDRTTLASAEWKVFFDGLRQNTVLKSLDLSGLNLRYDESDALFAALLVNRTLTSVRVHFCCTERLSVLAQVLRANTPLRALDISHNFIKCKGDFEKMVDALAHNRTLTFLAVPDEFDDEQYAQRLGSLNGSITTLTAQRYGPKTVEIGPRGEKAVFSGYPKCQSPLFAKFCLRNQRMHARARDAAMEFILCWKRREGVLRLMCHDLVVLIAKLIWDTRTQFH